MYIANQGQNDINEIVEIAKSLPAYFTPAAVKSIKQDADTGKVFTAKVKNKTIGFIIVDVVNEFVVEVIWMAVAKNNQNKGIGTLLIKKAVSEFKGKYKFLKVKTLAPNSYYEPYIKTRKFFKKNGFAAIEIIENYPGWEADTPCLIMVRQI